MMAKPSFGQVIKRIVITPKAPEFGQPINVPVSEE